MAALEASVMVRGRVQGARQGAARSLLRTDREDSNPGSMCLYGRDVWNSRIKRVEELDKDNRQRLASSYPF